MIAGTIWNQLVLTLQNNPVLASYVKYVYEGRRYDIVPENLPCIMIEPRQDGEIEKRMNQIQDVYFSVDIFAYSSNNYHQFPKTIVGDLDYKGILDINNDIRACLISSYDLGGNVIDTRLQSTLFEDGDPAVYPERGMLLPVKFLYRQNNGV